MNSMKMHMTIFFITLITSIGVTEALFIREVQAGGLASASNAEAYERSSPSELYMDDEILPPDDERTFGFSIRKLHPDGALDGAIFRLYNSLDDASHDTRPIEFTLDEEKMLYTACLSGGCPASSTLTADITAGIAYIEGLPAGTYYLVEIAAPGGFQKLHYPYRIELSTDGNVFYTEVMSGEPMIETFGGEVPVLNYATVLMPGTGGKGAYQFYIAGAACIFAALFMAIKRQRR